MSDNELYLCLIGSCVIALLVYFSYKSSPKECVNSILAQTQIKRPLDLGLVY